MRKYVFTVSDARMSENGKTESMLAQLTNLMREYGSLEEYEDVIAKQTYDLTQENASLIAQLNEAKLRSVSSDKEGQIINLIRELNDEAAAVWSNKYRALADKITSAQSKIDAQRAIFERQLASMTETTKALSIDVSTAIK